MGNYLGKNSRSLRRRERRPFCTHTAAPVSWGRGPSPQGWRRIQARRSTCLLCELCSVDGPSPWSWGRFIIASTPCFCVGIGDQHSGIVRLFEVV